MASGKYAGLSNEEYLVKRSEDMGKLNDWRIEMLEKNMQKEYNKQMDNIRKDIDSFFIKYAKDEGVDMQKVNGILSQTERANFEDKLFEFEKKASYWEDNNMFRMIEDLRSNKRITRLQMLEAEIKLQMGDVTGWEKRELEEFLVKHYQNNYEEEKKDICKVMNIKDAFGSPAIDAVKEIVRYPYSGDMFSNRIWKANMTFVETLTNTLKHGMIQGRDIPTMSKMLNKALKDAQGENYSMGNIKRIIRTESRFVQEQAKHDVNEEYGITEFKVVARKGDDNRRCNNCKKMKDKVFKESERLAGANSPPFHPQCRCTTAPHVSDEALEKAKNKLVAKAKQDYMNKNKESERNKLVERKPLKKGQVHFENLEHRIQYADGFDEMPKDFISNAKKSLEKNAPQNVKDFWNQFETYIDFEDVKSDRSCFMPDTGRVQFNFETDLSDRVWEKDQDTFFHEIAHLLDCKPNGDSKYGSFSHRYKDGLFDKTLRKEGKKWIDDLCKEKGAKGYGKRAYVVEEFLHQYPQAMAGASDILDGITDCKYNGGVGHDKDYWKWSPNLAGEAFVHFFVGSTNNPESLDLLKTIFPQSYKVFEEILEWGMKEHAK